MSEEEITWKKTMKKIDKYEERILSLVGIRRTDYRKGSMKHQALHYLDFGDPNSVCILLVHGYGGSGVTYFKVIPELMKNFRVICPDLLGFGKSDRPDFEFDNFDSSLNFFTISIISLLNYLKIERMIIIGHSFGGLIAGHLAGLIPDRVIAAFLVSPAGFVDRTMTDEEANLLIKSVAKSFDLDADVMRLITYLTFDKKVPLFNYIKPGWLNDHIESFFRNKRLNLNKNETKTFIKYYKSIYSLKPCGIHSLWSLLKVGGYCQYPVIQVIRENPGTNFFVYFGDSDWLDFKSAHDACQKANISKEFHLLKNTNHQVFFQNPEAFLQQFYIDFNKLYRNNPAIFQ
jgi:abhydrolase domain-containing protein 5